MPKAPAPNPFAKAKSKASDEPKATTKKKDQNIVVLPEGEASEALKDLKKAKATEKQAKADATIAINVAQPVAMEKFWAAFAAADEKPETMKFQSHDKKALVTFVVQDRGGVKDVSDEQRETLEAVLGVEKTESILEETETYSFDSEIMNVEGVMDVLGPAVGKATEKLVKDGVLTEEQAAGLLQYSQRTVVKKGTLNKLSKLCDGDPQTMEQAAQALGSNVTAYLKA